MTATVQIFYHTAVSDCRIMRSGSFQLKGRNPEQVAFDWWRQINKRKIISYIRKTDMIGQDITEIIK